MPVLRGQKLMGLEDAARLVKDGDQVIFHGGMDATPMAFLRQLVRNGVTGLHTLGVIGGAINLDMLIGSGTSATTETCSLGFGKYARVGPNYERFQKAGETTMLDNT